MANRRNKGEGSVYQRSNGYWVAQYHGKYKYSKSKQQAQKKLLELLKQDGQQQDIRGSSYTVAAYMAEWIVFAEQNLKPATVKRYREAVKIYIEPELGSKMLSAVDARTVQQMYSQMLSSGLSASTVNLVHAVLSSSLGRAVKWNLLNTNPMTCVDAPRITHKEIEVFTPTKVQQLLSAASQRRYTTLFLLALSTGARIGELLALEHKHVNLEAGTLDIRQTTTLNGTLGTPKSRNSIRTIQLPQIVLDALKQHSNNSSFLFPSKSLTITCPLGGA
jgi:integrase